MYIITWKYWHNRWKRVHLQLQLKPGFNKYNVHPDCPSHLRIRVMISGIAFNCSDHLSRLRIFPYDCVKFYTIVQFVRKNSGLPKMIEVISIMSGMFAFALVVFSYNCPNLVNIIILRWQPTVPAINSQQSANYRLTDTEIWLKVVRMSNTSANFFLNTYQLSLCMITVFIQVESTVTHTCSFHLWVLLLLMTFTLEQEQHWLEEPLWSVSDNPGLSLKA